MINQKHKWLILVAISVILTLLFNVRTMPVRNASAVNQPKDDGMLDVTRSFTKDVSSWNGYASVLPPITRIWANNSHDGHITRGTTQLRIIINGQLIAPHRQYINEQRFSLNQDPKTEVGSTNPIEIDNGNQVNYNQSSYLLNIDQQKLLNSNGQLWLTNTTKSHDHYGNAKTFQTTQFRTTVAPAMTLQPKITTTQISAGDQTIAGIGTQAGDLITASDGTNTVTSLVNDDKRFSVTFKHELLGDSIVGVTESNNYGDHAGDASQKVLNFIQFKVPKNLDFLKADISSPNDHLKVVALRADNNWGIDVLDATNLGHGSIWTVTGTLKNNQLVGDDGQTLKNPMIYQIDDEHVKPFASGAVPMFSNNPNNPIYGNAQIIKNGYLSSIHYKSNQVGPRIQVQMGSARPQTYHGTMNFTLVTGPSR